MPSLSIIVPTRNEAPNIGPLVSQIQDALSGITDYEIIFVDDSTDHTPHVIEMEARLDARIRLHHRVNGRGLASAVVEGMTLADGDYMIVMDADLQHPPSLLPKIYYELWTADMVIPTRFAAGGSDGGLNGIRKFISWGARQLGRLMLKDLRDVTDCTGGYFGLRRQVIQGAHLDPIGWKILIEVLCKGRYGSVTEVPYSFQERLGGESKLGAKEQIEYLRHIWRLAWAKDIKRFMAFCMVGASGFLVNMLVMRVLLRIDVNAIAGSVVASLVAMSGNFVLNDAITWRGVAATRKGSSRARQITTYFLISTGGVVSTWAMFSILYLGFRLDAMIAQFVGVGVSSCWTYALNKAYTWREGRKVDVIHVTR